MATKHWGQDAYLDDNLDTSYGGNNVFAQLLLYHMLRTSGFTWLWECDGEVGPNYPNPNHCDDGNMEEAGRAKWTDVGTPTITKDTAQVRSGVQSLKIVTDAAGEGVLSNALLSVTNPTTVVGAVGDSIIGPANGVMTLRHTTPGESAAKNFTDCRIVASGFTAPGNNGTFNVKDPFYGGLLGASVKIFNAGGVSQVDLTGASWSYQRKYTVAVWARNIAGNAWDVEVDPGDGAFINVGTIPVDAGGWRLYFFHFWAISTGSRYVRVLDPTGGNTLYIDGILIFRSALEYAPANVYGTDGILTAPDRFSTNGSYTCSAQDIGKYLFVWDSVNNKNTGYYKVLSDLGGGVIQVDMRSATHVFVTTTIPPNPLNWRLVDIVAQAHNDLSPNFQVSMGFGVQSPHTSGWRFFQRASNSSNNKTAHIWAAPDDDASFDWSTGQFYGDGPSTQRPLANQYVYATFANNQTWCGPNSGGETFETRDWFMTDEDRSFISFVHIYASCSHHSCFFVGYTGADPDHPGIEEFVSQAVWGVTSTGEIGWDTSSFTYSGITFGPDGMGRVCGFEVLGYGDTTASWHGMSNAGPNPWSGREWLTPMIVVREPAGIFQYSSERDSDCGLYMCRTNMTNLITFDSGNFLHFMSALVWEWNGEAII